MADDQRVYSDEEFAHILQQAAELASREEPVVPVSGGLTLMEIKAVAAQVGIDPSFVERAARIPVQVRESTLERLIGGPLRHSTRYLGVVDKKSAGAHQPRMDVGMAA